ncbi:MAG: hypothetical protein KIT87_28845, partial [Anaerolineae bacterium]|nr:hypothetical protein [Anaerolineae bacterium]
MRYVAAVLTCLILPISVQAQWLKNLREVPVNAPVALHPQEPPTLKLYLDRVVYAPLDGRGQGLAVVNPPALLAQKRLKEHRLRVWAQAPDGAILSAPTEVALTASDHIAFDLDLKNAPTGASKVVAILINAQGETVASAETPFRLEALALSLPVLPVRVPIETFAAPVLGSEKGIPIRTGIPMPNGLLHDAMQVRMLENEVEVPCQTTVRARWSKDGAIRWLGLDFQAAYDEGQPRRYVLEIGRPAGVTAPGSVTVMESPEAYVLANGRLRAVINRKQFRLFDEIRLIGKDGTADKTCLIEAGAEDGPYWVNAAGKTFRACWIAKCRCVCGSSRPIACHTARRRTVADDGDRAGKFVTRITLCAGRSEIDVNHTFILTWDTLERDMRVRDLGIAVSPIALEEAGVTYTNWEAPLKLPSQGAIHLLADRWNRFFVRDSQSGAILRSRHSLEDSWGVRAYGWFGGYGPRGAVAVAQRNFWELFPKEIEVGNNRLTWRAWPRHGMQTFTSGLDILDFVNLRWLHQGELLDFQIPDDYFTAVEEFKALTPGMRWRWGGDNRSGYGTGTAMTGELRYLFSAPVKNSADFIRDMDRSAVLFETNPHAVAAPGWSASCEVVDGLSDRHPAYAQIERGISEMFDRSMAVIPDNNAFGQFIWPNGYIGYVKGGSIPALHRARVNYHHGADTTAWRLYLRTGEAKYWRYALAKSRRLLDTATVNYDPMDLRTDTVPVYTGGWPGAVWHCDGYVPWGSYSELWGHQGAQTHAALMYFLTGDTQALDLIWNWTESVLKLFRSRDDYTFSGQIDRNPANGWMVATNVYADFQDPRLLRLIGEFADQLFAQPMKHMSTAPPQGQAGRHWLYAWLHRWRDPRAQQLLVEWVHAYTRSGPMGPGYSWPVKALDDEGKQLKAEWNHLGQSREVDRLVAGPSYGACSTHYAEASRASGNPSYVRHFWLETLGLAPLRQWALGHPHTLVSEQYLADFMLNMLPLIEPMAQQGLPEAPCLFPWDFINSSAYAVFRKDDDQPFTVTLWGRMADRSA